jgi:hypothetical protein
MKAKIKRVKPTKPVNDRGYTHTLLTRHQSSVHRLKCVREPLT